MSDVTKKSIGILIDELITVSNKIWHLQDMVEENKSSNEVVADAFRKIQTLNVRRNALINALDKSLDQSSFSMTEKTYS